MKYDTLIYSSLSLYLTSYFTQLQSKYTMRVIDLIKRYAPALSSDDLFKLGELLKRIPLSPFQ